MVLSMLVLIFCCLFVFGVLAQSFTALRPWTYQAALLGTALGIEVVVRFGQLPPLTAIGCACVGVAVLFATGSSIAFVILGRGLAIQRATDPLI